MKAAVLVLGVMLVLGAQPASAHCDSLAGPVVSAARAALEKQDVTPVLKWVKPEHEAEVREAFQRALKVHGQGGEARELADLYFFETVVRVHRAGEGAPYTGLKADGVEPPIAATDKALESGDVETLARQVGEHAAAGIRERFARAAATRKQADTSVAAGREFVEAYVQLTHYVLGLHQAVHAGEHAGQSEHKH